MPSLLEKVKDQIDGLNRDFQNDFKAINDKIAAMGEEVPADLKATLERIQTAMDAREAQIKAMETTHKLLAARLDRPSLTGGVAIDEDPEYMKAFFSWVRLMANGKTEAMPDSIKSILTIGDDSTGGVFAPMEFDLQVIKDIQEFSDLRRFARVRSIGKPKYGMPLRKTVPRASWENETDAPPETGSRYALKQMEAHGLLARVKVSADNLEDSDLNLESEVRMDVVEQFAVAEGTAFILGNGNGKPEGVLVHTGIGEVVSTTAGKITYDDIINLTYEPKTAYRQGSAYLLHRHTIREVRKVKDANGNYIWQAQRLPGQAPTIEGYEYAEMADMPAPAANGTYAAGTTPMVFGNFQQGYQITDRIQIQVTRLNEADWPNVVFGFRKRVDGQVRQAEAIKKLRIS